MEDLQNDGLTMQFGDSDNHVDSSDSDAEPSWATKQTSQQ